MPANEVQQPVGEESRVTQAPQGAEAPPSGVTGEPDGGTTPLEHVESLLVVAAELIPARTEWPRSLNRFPFTLLGFLRRPTLRMLGLVTQDQRRSLEFVVAAFRSLIAHGAMLESRQREAAAAMAEQAAQRQRDLQAFEAKIEEMEARWRRELTAVEARVQMTLQLNALSQRVTPRPSTAGSAEVSGASGGAGAASAPGELDLSLIPGFYQRFEEQFRGDPELVRLRQSVFLPDLSRQEAKLGALPVVDLGCGRGEWLELMRANGVLGMGVDLNPDFLKVSRSKGFDVAEADAVQWLESRPDASLRGITAFHVIEHISFTDLVRLLHQAHRTLAPGGLLILETPNPENLTVGACSFYLDPTHRRPIVPDLLSLTAREVGFASPTLRRLSEYRYHNPLRMLSPESELAATLNPLIEAVSRTLYAAPDYALLATRA
jgi:SAM-dependent methyltransferase